MATVLENYYALRVELEQRMTQAPINANENADNIIKQIPLFLELMISNPFSLITKLQFQTNFISY